MHFKGFIVTKEIPTEEKISNMLQPYYYGNDDAGFSWDWYQIGGRFGGEIKIKFNPNENEDNWYVCHDRNNKYFISQAINELKKNIKQFYDELDWLIYMGLRENILYVDGGYYNDMIDFDITDCYLVIDDDENLYLKESWNGNEWKTNDNFDEQIKKIDLKDKFITIIDFHD